MGERGSRKVFTAFRVNQQRLLTAVATLPAPLFNVVRLTISPFFQRTALASGTPSSGSITPVSDSPAISPFALIQLAKLLFAPGRAPRSVRTPLYHWNACMIKGSGGSQRLVFG